MLTGRSATNGGVRHPVTARAHGDFAAALRFSDLGPHEVQAAKLLIIDALASGFAARGTQLDMILEQALVHEAYGECTLIGHPATRRLHQSAAAWANGSLIHALDFDDIPHFGAVELPPLMCVAQHERTSGRGLLTAIVAGFEVAARLTAALAHGHMQHPIGLVGPVAAAVAVCNLLGADADVTATAIGIALSQGGGLTQNFGTLTKPLHAGRAAQSGLLAARLATAGWTADPAIIDGPKGFLAAHGQHDELIDGYDEPDRFWISRSPADRRGAGGLDPTMWPPALASTPPDVNLIGCGAPPDQRRGGPNLKRGPSFKPWPACGGNNAVLTAALSLLLDPAVDRGQIEHIEVVVPSDPERGAVFRTRPANGLEGKFSLGYGVAAAWLDGAVTVESYTDESYDRLRESGLLERVNVRADPDFIRHAPSRPADPDCNWSAVTVVDADGDRRTAWAFNRGVELAEHAVFAKYLFYAERVLGARAASASLASLVALEQTDDCASLPEQWCVPTDRQDQA